MKKILLVFVTFLCFSLLSRVFALSLGDNVQLFGFASQGYLKTLENNYLVDDSKEGYGVFDFSEVALTLYISPLDNLRIGMQLFANDLGNFGNHNLKIDWAYADYRINDSIGLRIGKIKVPMGLFSQTWDIDVARVPILLPQAVYFDPMKNIIMTATGLDVYGNIDLGNAGDLDYEAQYGANVMDHEDTLFKKSQEYALGGIAKGVLFTSGIEHPLDSNVSINVLEDVRVDDVKNERFNYFSEAAAKIAYNTPFGLKIGGSYSMYKFEQKFDVSFYVKSNAYVEISNVVTNFSNTGQYIHYRDETVANLNTSPFTITFFLEYLLNNLSVSGEYSLRAQKNETTTSAFSLTMPRENTSEAWYVMLSYRFSDLFTLGGYYCSFITEIEDRDGQKAINDPFSGKTHAYQTWQRNVALTTRFDINDHWLLKLEAHYINGSGLTGFYTPSDAQKADWWMFLAKTTFHF